LRGQAGLQTVEKDEGETGGFPWSLRPRALRVCRRWHICEYGDERRRGGREEQESGGGEGGGACDRRLDLVVCDLNQRANARAYVAAVPGAGRQAFHGNGGAARLPLTHPPRATAPCNFLHACRLPRDKFSVILSYFAPMSYVGRKAIK